MLGINFHGLEWILGCIYEFSCGHKSAGKFTGLNKEDDDASPPGWMVQASRVFIFYSGILFDFQYYYCYPVY